MKCRAAAEFFAATAAVDDFILIRMDLSRPLRIQLKAFAVIDAKDVLNSLMSQRNYINHWIWRDVNYTLFFFKT